MQVDTQTISDIELFSKNKKLDSIYECYNNTATIGGSEKLYKYLRNPVSDIDFLNERKAEIFFFCENDLCLDLDKRQIYFIEHYRKNSRFPLRANWIDAFADGLKEKIREDRDYYTIQEGIFHLIGLMANVKLFLEELKNHNVPKSLQLKLEHCNTFMAHKQVAAILSSLPKKSAKIKWLTLGRLDTLFRVKMKTELEKFLDIIYSLDVLQCLADLVVNKNYSLATYKDNDTPIFEVEDCFYPFLDTPIINTFAFNHGCNLCFLTGPNMSGKSTFLKTVGLIVYLAHLGFPVPAKRLVTTVQKGLFTTINLSDNLNLGYSHFYSEVKRVKDMALELQSLDNIFVIFDELFKGTNVKDAYDSTLMVVRALSKIRNSIFFISSHILEVAEDISESAKIDFRCFESSLKNEQAEYDYKLKRGISKERVGFQIVQREKIEEILESISKSQS